MTLTASSLGVRRSYLFVPGDDARKIGKALISGADAVVLDLEDAVAPERKAVAREVIRAALPDFVTSHVACVVRIGAQDGAWRDDLEAVVRPGLHAVRVPKVQGAEDVLRVAQVLASLEAAAGLTPGTVRLQCTIESAVGVLRSEQIAGADRRIEALVFGHADFAADIGVTVTDAGTESLMARSWLVLCSRSAGIGGPLDGAFTALGDEEGLRRSVALARTLGFCGKSAIHPRQVAVINAGFSPTEAEIEAATEQLAAFEAALKLGVAVAKTTGGQFVDEAVAKRARTVLALAKSAAGETREEPR